VKALALDGILTHRAIDLAVHTAIRSGRQEFSIFRTSRDAHGESCAKMPIEVAKKFVTRKGYFDVEAALHCRVS
jgi:hypothetical protein